MKRKSEDHEDLSLMFQRYGVPPQMIVDVSKDHVEGDFTRKCKEVGCHLKQTEPYSPWKNASEGYIKDLKRGAVDKMLKSCSPKRLRYDCVELELYAHYNKAHNIYCINGETPETIMSGETSDISQFCELGWYE